MDASSGGVTGDHRGLMANMAPIRLQVLASGLVTSSVNVSSYDAHRCSPQVDEEADGSTSFGSPEEDRPSISTCLNLGGEPSEFITQARVTIAPIFFYMQHY